MSLSLADLRATKPTGRPERVVPLCLAPALVTEIQTLTAEHDRLALTVSVDDEEDGPPTRIGGSKSSPRAKEIKARLAVLLEEMSEYEGEMRLRANLTDGEWRRWANEHPARGEGEPGHDRDQRVTAGYCDADALIDELGKFACDWNGETLGATDWTDIFEPVIGTPDKAAMASAVVGLYESRLDFHLLRSSLSANLKRLNDSGSPAASGSPTSDSTAGSPDEFTAATTSTASA